MDTIRQQLRERRRHIDVTLQSAASAAVARRASPLLTDVRSLGAYASARGEIDPGALVDDALRHDVPVYLPRVTAGRTMVFARWHAESVGLPGAFGIIEPPEHAEIRPAARLDTVLVPLVAFDRSGTRLGSGAGFYDRAFAFRLSQPRGSRPRLIGLAYHWQEVDSLDRQVWDVPLDFIVTDAEVIEP